MRVPAGPVVLAQPIRKAAESTPIMPQVQWEKKDDLDAQEPVVKRSGCLHREVEGGVRICAVMSYLGRIYSAEIVQTDIFAANHSGVFDTLE